MSAQIRRDGLLVLVCALPRLVYLWATDLPATTVYYWMLSDGWLKSGDLVVDGVPTTEFEPLYPAFLAAARWLTGDHAAGVIVIQIVVACVGALLLDRLVRTMTGVRAAGAVAALCYAWYPYLIRQTVAWMEITLLSTCLLGAWLAWARVHERSSLRAAVACGTCLGLAVLTRAMVIPIALFAVAWWWAQGLRREASAAGLVLVVLLGPWMIRNARIDGSILPTRNGENLFVGNNEYSDVFIPRYDLDLLPDLGTQRARARLGLLQGSEPSTRDWDRALTDEAFAFVRAQPWRALKLKIANGVYFFSPRLVPYDPMGPDTTITLLPGDTVIVHQPRRRTLLENAAHSVTYTLIAVAALVGAFRRNRWRADALMLASLGVFTLVAIVYFPTTRMRAPVDPILMAYAGCAWAFWRHGPTSVVHRGSIGGPDPLL